jgi:hypothetical protein
MPEPREVLACSRAVSVTGQLRARGVALALLLEAARKYLHCGHELEQRGPRIDGPRSSDAALPAVQ